MPVRFFRKTLLFNFIDALSIQDTIPHNVYQPYISQIMATTATFPSLPVELLLQISEQLSYGSHIALSFTCRELYVKVCATFQPSTSLTHGKAYTMDDLLEIESWPEYNPRDKIILPITVYPHRSLINFLACRICLKIRRAAKFPSFFKFSYLRGYSSYSLWPRSRQVCVPCAIANGVYGHKTESYSEEYKVYTRVCSGCNLYSEHLHSVPGKWICDACQKALEER